jgi:hypothetical protein
MLGTIQDNIIRVARSRYRAPGIFAVIKQALVILPITNINKKKQPLLYKIAVVSSR